MELIKSNWTKENIKEFYIFEKTLKGEDKNCEWEKRIVNTSLECYARTSSKAREIANKIKKGNAISFLQNIKIKTHFDSLVCAFLISSLKDFYEFEIFLDKYVLTIDNWASADTLRFQKRNKEKLFALSKKYLNSAKPFVRRVGLNIFFELIKYNEFVTKIFDVINSLKNEKEYYVNMCAAWLLAECFAKHRDLTLSYFENCTTNNFIINKAISKCRDSFRVSQDDKNYLLKFKK